MTRDKKEKIGKEQLLLEASRLGRLDELETILSQSQPYRLKKKTNPLASLRKPFGPNSARDPATGFTCLHHAALNGHSECVKLILFYGAKLNAVDYKGSSALHLSAWAGNLDVVQILLAHNVALSNEQQRLEESSNTSGNSGNSTVDKENTSESSWKACLFRNQEPLEIDLCNNDNQTPLSLAAQFGHNQVVAELIRHGANVHIRNNQLESALDLACLSGRLETVRLLLDSSPELHADLRRAYSAIPIAAAKSNLGSPRGTGSGWSSTQHPTLQRTQSMFQDAGEINNQIAAAATSSVSKPSWVSLLRRNSHATTAGVAQQQQASPRRKSSDNNNSAQSSPNAAKLIAQNHEPNSESNNSSITEHGLKLLLHSPLHYATRRGHHNLVSMLLYSYKANILQVSSLGGVLHEIALANGKHLDLIGVFFQFIANRFGQASQSSGMINNSISCLPEMIDKFLDLKNEQQQTVFQLLTQINNRSAHETRELIYRFSEQCLKLNHQAQKQQRQAKVNQTMQQQQQVVDTTSAIPQQTSNLNNNSNNQNNSWNRQHQQEQQQQLIGEFQSKQTHNNNNNSNNNNININNNPNMIQDHPNYHATRQPHQMEHQQFCANQMQFYSSQQQQQPQFSDIKQINSFVTMKRVPKHAPANQQLQQTGQMNAMQLSSQFNAGVNYQSQHQQCQQINYGTQTIDRRNNNNNLSSFQQQQQQGSSVMQQHHASFHDESFANPTMSLMTRSVSNLTNWLPHHDTAMQNASNLDDNPNYGSRPLAPYNAHQQQQMFQQAKISTANRQYLSRSRDLGSLLQEAKRQQLQQQQQNQQQSNDFPNEATQGSTNQLVRSQTDCSHLMNRFFGDNNAMQTSASSNPNQLQQQQQQQHHMLMKNMIPDDRKSINRHYHVYDHQFYPPRIMGDNPAAQSASKEMSINKLQQQGPLRNQLVAVIPPITRDNQLRSSARSAILTSQVVSIDPSSGPSSASQQQQQQVQSSRHSLNMENNQQQTSNQLAQGTPRQDLIELQRRIQAEQQQTINFSQQQQQMVPIHGSMSLESHLNDTCSSQQQFDATRRAIMNDFDQLIGQELLNRNHALIIGNHSASSSKGSLLENQSQSQQNGITNSTSSSSILTGVMLDMDKSGSQLTVSGTRISFNQPHQAKASSNNVSPITTESQTNNNNNESRQLESRDISSSCEPSINPTENIGQHKQQRQMAPPKPPRPVTMLMERPSSDNLMQSNEMKLATANVGSRLSLTQAPRVKPPPPPVPPQPAARTSQRLSLRQQLNIVASQGPQQTATNPNQDFGASGQPAVMLLSSANSVCSNGSSRSDSTNINVENSNANADAASGLIKMQGNSICRQQQQQTLIGSKQSISMHQPMLNDQDSGVCTSNSPASLSHESDKSGEYQEQQQQQAPPRPTALNIPERADRCESQIASPPSPNTAQMCIEEAFIPLAGNSPITNEREQHASTRHSVASGTCDPNESGRDVSLSNRDHMIDWLVKAAAVRTTNDSRDPDYDNLLDDDGGHDKARDNAHTRPLSTMVHYDGDAGCIDDDDEDYAETTINGDDDNDRTVNSSSSSPDETTSDTCSNTLISESPEKVKASSMKEPSKKEFMLKVVIDNANLIGSDDKQDIFYIDPLELKKIVANGNSKADAETITDEELSAAIDENSGLIKFTLRKRRNESEQNTQTPVQISALRSSNDDDGNYAFGIVQDATMSSAAKKTRLTSHASLEQPQARSSAWAGNQMIGLGETPMAHRRHSEVVASMAPEMRPMTGELARWFSSKLAGLIEYESKFASHGIDCLAFMNHPSLMNDHLLKSIGIENESHRMLILETIKQDLPLVDFNKILLLTENNQQATIGQLFQLLSLDALLETKEFSHLGPALLTDKLAVELLRCRAMESLSLAHRIRLSLALDSLSTIFVDENATRGEARAASLTQQSSFESSSSSSAVDSELTSHGSSSSDLQSIKSVVSIRGINQQANWDETTKKKESTETLCNDSGASPIEDISSEHDKFISRAGVVTPLVDEAKTVSSLNDIEHNIKQTSESMSEVVAKSEDKIQTFDHKLEQDDDHTESQVEVGPEIDSKQTNDVPSSNEKTTIATTTTLRKHATGSMVSQVARRIEEENARIAQNQQHKSVAFPASKPVAAIRSKFSQSANKICVSSNKENNTDLAKANQNIVRSTALATEQKSSVLGSSNSTTFRGKLVTPAYNNRQLVGPVAQSNSELQTSVKPKSKLDEIRMSFERQIEENAANTKLGISLNQERPSFRLKPPPPAKPANLIQVPNKMA